MPQRKKLPYKILVSRLLKSNKLASGQHAAFEQLMRAMEAGRELTEHEKLWVESVRAETDI